MIPFKQLVVYHFHIPNYQKFLTWSEMILQVPRCNNTSETKSGSSNGTSRAFELGSELQISPIVVEDLEHPGHMLIEVCSLQFTPFSVFRTESSFSKISPNSNYYCLLQMLCDEHGLFLEIAQAIRRLELTVLKGVMETRSNNLWAHFIVEV